MKYELLVWHTHNDDWDCDSQNFDTLQECVDYFHSKVHSYGVRQNVYINDKRIEVKNKTLVENGEPYSTNPAYHEVFGNPIDKLLHPIQSQIIPSCTNPATLLALGVDV